MSIILKIVRGGKTYSVDLTPFIYGTKSENAWEESKHPRDKDGKFGKGGAMRPKTETPKPKVPKGEGRDKAVARLTGNELTPKDVSLETLRKAASSFYERRLNGTSVKNHKIGIIKFSSNSGKKALSFSADPEKLRVIPALRDILSKGDPGELLPDKKNRPNIKGVYRIRASVFLNGKLKEVAVIVRKDNNGQLYYDHYIVKAL